MIKRILIMIMILTLVSCGAENNSKETVEPVETTQVSENEPTAKNLSCGEAYSAGDLSYNIIGVKTEDNILRLAMEVYNNSSDDISFTPMGRLTVYNESGDECSWNMMVGDLNGLIMPDNKIMGEVGFDLEGDSNDYVLHIGSGFEYKPAIKIKSSDIGMTFDEVFESSGVASDYTIGTPVESDIFTMTVNDALIKSCDKDGKEVLLIDLSIMNNDSEAHALGLEISGVYTLEGEALSTAVLDWTFPNYEIEAGSVETGIVSYYCEEGKKDFYMVVKPNIREFDKNVTIVFSVE